MFTEMNRLRAISSIGPPECHLLEHLELACADGTLVMALVEARENARREAGAVVQDLLERREGVLDGGGAQDHRPNVVRHHRAGERHVDLAREHHQQRGRAGLPLAGEEGLGTVRPLAQLGVGDHDPRRAAMHLLQQRLQGREAPDDVELHRPQDLPQGLGDQQVGARDRHRRVGDPSIRTFVFREARRPIVQAGHVPESLE